MRLRRLTIRGFRNLADGVFDFPPSGVALLGSNGQGKTNLLEAIYYPVLFRSLRGSADVDLVRFAGSGFHVALEFEGGDRVRTAATTFQLVGRRKRHQVDGVDLGRLVDGAGSWLAVAFLPADVALASGPSAQRRFYLDRTLALADRRYLEALTRYRAALAQRNAALKQSREDMVHAFESPLAVAGAQVIRARLEWVGAVEAEFAREFAALGERAPARLHYAGHQELADPACWGEALARSARRDRAQGMTTVGPHRDDLQLMLEDRLLREFGSTGQQRSAAVALKLVEWRTLEQARGQQPALLLDDVFAELDRERQERLAQRLRSGMAGQLFLTSPRLDEFPPHLELPVWRVEDGKVLPA